MGWGTLFGAIADIIDKIWPNRRQRLREKILAQEKKLEQALLNNDVEQIALTRKQLEELRKQVSDLE